MIFTEKQINELLKIVDYHSSFSMMTSFGVDSLNDYDRFVLNEFGINIDDFKGVNSPYYNNYLWGKLSSLLGGENASKVTYDDLLQYVKSGQYIPLTKIEKIQYDIAKNRTYGKIRDFHGKVRKEIRESIYDEELSKRDVYEKVLHDEIKAGIEERKSISSIVSDIGHKFDRWDKDYGRIVETEMNDIYQLGISEQIRESGGGDALVYKDVYEGACRFCIKFYLTGGIGSEPKVYKLSELIQNGTNYGKKQDDWLPVVGSVHPFCRCQLRVLPKNYIWDADTNSFIPKKLTEETRKVKRKSKVRVQVGKREFYV